MCSPRCASHSPGTMDRSHLMTHGAIPCTACGRFHTVGNDLAILLNKDTFVSGAAVFTISEASTSKDTSGLAALVVRGLLRRPSVVDSPTVTFCSFHLHHKIAKKRYAWHMISIGSDFNMSAFSTLGDVFSDPEFAAFGNSLLWGLGGLDEICRESTEFIIMPRHPHTWRLHAHGWHKFDNADMGFGPRDLTAHFPAFLHLRVTNLPGFDSIMQRSRSSTTTACGEGGGQAGAQTTSQTT